MPITYHPEADIASDAADILVNTVNTVGTMGKGVALAMKERFPEILEPYKQACRTGRLQPGGLQIVSTKDGRRVVNLATKQDWRRDSRSEWIGYGLFALNSWLSQLEQKPRSISLPMPGAGNGGLSPSHSQDLIRTYLAGASGQGIEIRILSEQLEPGVLPLIYAGVGARKTPYPIGELMTQIAERASADEWTLRSGGAEGADTFFERGAGTRAEIHLAKPRASHPHGLVQATDLHRRLVEKFHPRPRSLSPNAYELMARNGCQVFGSNFTRPVSVLCCWTPGGAAGGGTGQAIRYARAAGIPVLDLGDPAHQGITADEAYDELKQLASDYRAARGFSTPTMSDAEPELDI